MKGLLLYLSRWGGAAILLLAFVAFGALCLWAGLVVGTEFVQWGASFIEAAWIPEELHLNAPKLVSAIPLAAAVVAAIHGSLPTLLTRFWTSIVRFLEECLKLAAGQASWLGEPDRAGLLPSFLAPCPHLIAAAFLFGSYGAPTEPPRPPVTYVFSPDSMPSVLPIHPLVHFENAAVGAAGELTEHGTTLQDARRVLLKEFVQRLRQCATSSRPVTIRPYGFASDDPFEIPGIDHAESNGLNVGAANLRALSVYDALTELISELIEPEEPGGMTVEAPTEWNTFKEMASRRNSMIRVPEESNRDPFADRVVVLHLTSFGTCRPVDPPAPSDAAAPLAPTNAVPLSNEPAMSRSDSPVENAAMTGKAEAAAGLPENHRAGVHVDVWMRSVRAAKAAGMTGRSSANPAVAWRW